MRAGLLLLLVVVLCAATAAPARADSLVTRPHAKQPLSDKRAAKLVSARASSRGRATTRCERTPTAAQLRAFRAQSEMPYARYVTGRFKGTTDEVIQWAARKWGFTPDCCGRWRRSSRGGG